jgi:hypothetical protein
VYLEILLKTCQIVKQASLCQTQASAIAQLFAQRSDYFYHFQNKKSLQSNTILSTMAGDIQTVCLLQVLPSSARSSLICAFLVSSILRRLTNWEVWLSLASRSYHHHHHHQMTGKGGMGPPTRWACPSSSWHASSSCFSIAAPSSGAAADVVLFKDCGLAPSDAAASRSSR